MVTKTKSEGRTRNQILDPIFIDGVKSVVHWQRRVDHLNSVIEEKSKELERAEVWLKEEVGLLASICIEDDLEQELEEILRFSRSKK